MGAADALPLDFRLGKTTTRSVANFTLLGAVLAFWIPPSDSLPAWTEPAAEGASAALAQMEPAPLRFLNVHHLPVMNDSLHRTVAEARSTLRHY